MGKHNKKKNKYRHHYPTPMDFNTPALPAVSQAVEVEVTPPDSVLEAKFVEKFGKPIVEIAPRVHALICHLHEKIPACEWSGYGKLEKVEGKYIMTDIIFPEQRNSTGLTEITDAGKEWLCDRLVAEKEDLGKWKIWFHSHHSMGVFWSGTDHAAMNMNGDDGAPYFVNIVTSYMNNVNGQRQETWDDKMYKATMSVYIPKRFNIDMIVQLGEIPELNAIIERIYNSQLREKQIEIDTKLESKQKAILLLDEKYANPPVVEDADAKMIIDTLNISGIEVDETTMDSVKEFMGEEWRSRKAKELEAIEKVFKVPAIEDAVDYGTIVADTENDFFGTYISDKYTELQRNQARTYAQNREYSWGSSDKKGGKATSEKREERQNENMEKVKKDAKLIEDHEKDEDDDIAMAIPNHSKKSKANLDDYDHLSNHLYTEVSDMIDMGFPKSDIEQFIKERGESPTPKSTKKFCIAKGVFKYWEELTPEQQDTFTLKGLGPIAEGDAAEALKNSVSDPDEEPLMGAGDLGRMQAGYYIEKNRWGLRWECVRHKETLLCDKCRGYHSGYFVTCEETDESYCEGCFEKHFSPHKFR